jgi:RecA DNA recombination protein
MSSLPCNTGNDAAPFFPVQFQDFQEKRASVLKHIARSERLAEVRPASRLEVRPRPEMLSTGIPELDALTGGIPRGCLTEIYGSASSGKTSVLLATIAAATRREETCVLVDASDSFDPASGQAAGIDFGKLLWVRSGVFENADAALRRVGRHLDVNDRRPTTNDLKKSTNPQSNSEHRLEQILKTTDLILQSGGFGLVALDLAGIPEKFVRRIPLASWFRFQRAVEHTKTALLVVSEFPCAQTCAALVVRLEMNKEGCPTLVSPIFGETGWGKLHQPSETPAHAQLLENMCVKAEIVRSRLERKPAQSVKQISPHEQYALGDFLILDRVGRGPRADGRRHFLRTTNDVLCLLPASSFLILP